MKVSRFLVLAAATITAIAVSVVIFEFVSSLGLQHTFVSTQDNKNLIVGRFGSLE